jgi:hypothetical protein
LQNLWWVLVPGVIAAAVYLALSWRRRTRPLSSDGSVDESAAREYLLVILRRSPAILTADILEAAARRVWENRFGLNTDGAAYVCSGSTGVGFVLEAHGNAFLVFQSDRNTRTLDAPREIHPPTAAHLWSEYSDDVSVGVVHNFDTEPAKLQAYVGSLAAALCDESTFGVFHLRSGQLWRLDRDLIETLAAEPAAFFSPS